MGNRIVTGLRLAVLLPAVFCAISLSSVARAGFNDPPPGPLPIPPITGPLVSGGISGVAYSHHWTNFTDPNARGPAVPGATVNLRYCKEWRKPALTTPYVCTVWANRQTTTDSNGAFSISVSGAVNPPTGTIGGLVATASVQNADETSTWWIPTFNGSIVSGNFLRVPLMLSPAKTVWLRRFGTGDYPFFFVEGFDPQNGTWTGDETAPGNNSSLTQAPSILRIMRNSPIGSAAVNGDTHEAPAGANNNMLDWLVANNYSVYVIASGANWASSQKGMLADHSDGIAYQAMALIKQVRDRFAPSRVASIGGYSLGGSVVRTGLLHWCNGDFSTIPGSQLTYGCPEVGLWWGADSPLDSATVPESLIRLMKDTGLRNSGTAIAYVQAMNSGAARELLETWTTNDCTTACLDEDGCASAQPGFEGGCWVDNNARVTFQDWNGVPRVRLDGTNHAALQANMPQRWGTLVPAVAFSLGKNPTNDPALGFLPEEANRGAPRFLNDQQRYMKIHLHTDATVFGIPYFFDVDADMMFYAKRAELRSGSRMDVLGTVKTASNNGGMIDWWGIATTTSGDPVFDFFPTFIPARSALLWTSDAPGAPEFWRDWRLNTEDGKHFGGFPNVDTGMILAWSSEFTKGHFNAPVATPHKTPSLRSRPPSIEYVDGRDDDGDEQVDEMQMWDGLGLTATWTDASNRWLTFVSQNRYWKYDSLANQFIPQTGYFGQGNYVPDVPMGNASIWFNAPLVDGMKPWDGMGITAAYTAPATGDWFGPAQHIVLFSQNRYWVYRGGDEGDQWWMAAGHVGDALWIPQVFPYFEASYTPTLNGVYPWDLSGITGVHYNEWGRTDQINITSEGRQWTYNLMDGTWSAPWERSGIPTAAWTNYDRSVQCIAANNPCAYLDCGWTPYWQGGFTHASCFATDGGWSHWTSFNISGWGDLIAIVRNGITNIQSFTPDWGASCPAGIGSSIQSACNGKQICNYELPQGCAGTARYICASYNASDWNQATATSGGTLGMPCPW